MSINFIVKLLNARRRFGLKFKLAPITGTFKKGLKTFMPNSFANNIRKSDINYIRTSISHFHVTSPKNALPPILMLVLRYVAKLGAVVSGRLIRKWWQKLPPEEKQKVLEKIRLRKRIVAFAGAGLIGGTCLFYIGHIVEDPITKRRKFIMLNQKQINQLGEFEYQNQLQMFRTHIVPSYHPLHRRVSRVANTLLLANRDLKEIRDKVWSVTVVDRPDITNAFALPHGKIFVFTGMLNVCTNDDQLAILLGHEISHSILCHVAESMSKVFLIDFILLIPTIIFWTIFPDVWALFSEWITSTLAKIFIHLPFSRSIEKEADVVGLQLAAKSCYDVREAPVFWSKMKVISNNFPVEWLSTHPRHEKRQSELQDLVPHALHIRDMSKCPPLSRRAPWNKF